MPKTESEWRALDAELTREVMGWVRDGFYWKDPNDATLCILTAEFVEELAAEFGCHVLPCRYWHPHSNREQAMQVLDVVRGKGYDINITLTTTWPDVVDIWGKNPEGCFLTGKKWGGRHLELSKAICLAAKSWLDAQKRR